MDGEKTTKLFSALRAVFIICFLAAVFGVVSVRYPLAAVAFLLAGGMFLLSRREIPRFGLLLFLFSLLLRLTVTACVTTPIDSDFKVQFLAAQQFAAGDYSFQNDWYFKIWGYQTGLVIYEGLLLRIWNDPLFLRLVNCVVAAGTNTLVYLIAKDYFSRLAAQTVSVAYAVFLFPMTLVTVLCNSIPAGFFLYLGLFLVMGKRFEKFPRPAVYALAGLSLAVGNALRPDAPVVLVPLAVYFLFRIFSVFTLKNLWHYLKRALALFLTVAVVSAGMSWLVKLSGVNAAGLENHDPLWGTVVGTCVKYGGIYNEDDSEAIARKIESGMSREEASQEVIRQHLSAGAAKLLEMETSKLHTFWWDRGMGWSLSAIRENTPNLYDYLNSLDEAMFTCALFLAAVGAVSLFLRREKDFKLYLLPFIIFSAAAVYLVLEVQPRYAYTVQIAVFLLAAGGVETLLEWGRALLAAARPHLFPQ